MGSVFIFYKCGCFLLNAFPVQYIIQPRRQPAHIRLSYLPVFINGYIHYLPYGIINSNVYFAGIVACIFNKQLIVCGIRVDAYSVAGSYIYCG